MHAQNLGEELDNGGDPPRVWAPGKSFPGCAFTRSIGDSVAESIGVTAEPELLRKELTEEDQFVVLVRYVKCPGIPPVDQSYASCMKCYHPS